MNKERILKVLKSPHISEKATLIADNYGHYVFKTLPDATKTEVKQAVELIFDVKVKCVRTLNRKGKVKRTARGNVKRSNQKLAYVSLEAGHDIEFADTE